MMHGQLEKDFPDASMEVAALYEYCTISPYTVIYGKLAWPSVAD